ncbi:MAG TPA: CheR family methyltransferase, partial [Thermoanaerobaculia bacterium]|nr:CheR family methyltransferase [Thermoanaerobaculia bacterium]
GLRGERPRSLHVWSAGCSTGEEPYSLAMTLLTHFDPAEWDLRVDATDLSTRVLETARAGVWPTSRAEEISKAHLRRFFLRGVGANKNTCKAGDELRSIIRFGRLNLTDPQLAMPDGYDLVFCRNVLIYFRNAVRTQVVGNLLHHLRDGGHLFLGHAETLAGIATGPRSVIPTVYVK